MIRGVRVLRHLVAIGLLPGMVAGVIPAAIVWGDEVARLPQSLLGTVVILLGLALIAQTVALFARVGRGTLAPWDPTERLVVRGPYRRVRNPMISGVLTVLLGETLRFGADYDAYRTAVPRWVPRLRPWRPDEPA